LAELEDALVRYSLEAVRKAGFQLISVPDIIYPHIIESCGMRTRSDRDQVHSNNDYNRVQIYVGLELDVDRNN